ncbi:hypothetical protein Gotri_006917 [Gossypium trilobum]|uniref:Mei2-like C-terminal RNA recognition motif domain-containing protein n=1 Tax=Gossypium trilobum TaxID=34281 RepID=A0A7J9FTC7_9ROSI|nr:hypothetical protein [Gossypium trilobum]
MAIVRADVAQDFPHNIGMRNWSLNPEAPEFFPARKRLLSASSPVFSPSTPIFLHYYTHPLLSASTFSHLSYTYPQPHALQPHFFIPEKAASASVPMTETVSPLLEPFKTTMVVDEAPEPRTAARKENLGGTRPSVRDKPYWKSDKRYGKKGFVIVDRNSSQARKKQCRGKPSSYSSQDQKHFAKTYPKKARGRAGNKYNKREKHPPIPLKPDGLETTVMIKNIPNRYTYIYIIFWFHPYSMLWCLLLIETCEDLLGCLTDLYRILCLKHLNEVLDIGVCRREMLEDVLDQHCMLTNKEAESQIGSADEDEQPSLSAFDFLYLPIDFVTKSNKGYAFVNFTNPKAARKFSRAWHNKHWPCINSNKIREIHCAKLQGREELVKHFENMEFPSENFQPLSFNPARDGSKQAVKETIVGRCIGSK